MAIAIAGSVKPYVALRSAPGLGFKKAGCLGQIRDVFAYGDTKRVVNLMLRAVK